LKHTFSQVLSDWFSPQLGYRNKAHSMPWNFSHVFRQYKGRYRGAEGLLDTIYTCH
jgi:hypothetical protein